MQLAKIRRKSRPVKKFFYEIWNIAVDLGGFGARRSGRRGAPGRSAARSAVVCGAAEGARRRGELPGASAARGGKAGVRGDGASTAGHKRGAGTASGTAGRARRAARDGGAGAAGYKRGSGRGGGGTVSGTQRVARGRGAKPRIFAAPQRRTAQSSLFQPSGRHLG